MSTEMIFLQLLKEVLLGETGEAFEQEIDMSALYIMAYEHAVLPIISVALERRGLLGQEDPMEAAFLETQLVSLYQVTQQEEELRLFTRLCEENKIPYIPLKGSVIRSMYPESFMRNSGDVDVLVHEKNLNKLLSLSRAAGYTVGERESHDVALRTPRGITIELHFTLFEYDKDIRTVLDHVWEGAKPREEGSYAYTLSPEHFVYYHMAHMLKHFLRGGCGVRFLTDLYVIRKAIHYDEAVLREMLRSTDMEIFYDAAVRVTDVWFSDGEHNAASQGLADFVLRAGILGNHANYMVVRQLQGKCRMAATMARFFPPYSYMRNQYPKLKGHRCLLPVYYVKRWADVGLKCGFKRYKNWKKAQNRVSEEQLEETKALLDSLGLLSRRV
ncbi:MAG: hypothetical protein E7402_00170 [Ruminococcaceae bacterium]|nr:hypothetical protein [Oscillospiraceae bacterium]